MNEFVTLSCPNCGGKLEVTPNTISLQCQNCGVEHMVSRETGSILLEGFARCPTCKRNDMATKVSVIVENNSMGIANKLELSNKPSPPPKPRGFGFFGYAIMLFIAFTIFFLFPFYSILTSIAILGFEIEENSSLAVLGAILIFIITVILIIILIIVFIILNRRKIQSSKKRYQIDFPKWKKSVEDWERAESIWKRLYYCARDGIIFIPATGESCDPDVLLEFIYS
ncbi:hypothetical protein ACFLXB_01240 [Chloroflexota bacterium]